MSDAFKQIASKAWQAKIQASSDLVPSVQSVVLDFLNQGTTAAPQRVEYVGGIFGKSLASTEYKAFSTRRPISFDDLDGMPATFEGTMGVRWHEITMSLRERGTLKELASVTWATKRRPTMVEYSPLTTGTLKVYYGQNGPPVVGRDLIKERKGLSIEEKDAPTPRESYYRSKSYENPVIPADALFDFDRAVLKPTAKKYLKKWLEILNERKLPVVLISGHTDSTGSHAYNLDLSSRRALAVKRWFVEHEVKDPGTLVAIPHGESDPVASNSTREGRRKNRRVVIDAR